MKEEKVKLSFDFDSTLSRKDVQVYAKQLVELGADVWICTSRVPTKDARSADWNDDLFAVAKRVGIPKDKVIFTSYADKADFLNGKGFLWHLDDDVIEISIIKAKSDVEGVSVFMNDTWEKECEELIKEYFSFNPLSHEQTK